MIYRRELTDHFAWLEGSKFLEEVLDEAIVAIALTACGEGESSVLMKAVWWRPCDVVERFALEEFVERFQENLL
ncbi:MAG: hypothetical protein U0R71_01960 [Solirubrobacterales bacterium]